MAGYIISLSDPAALLHCVLTGVYGTMVPEPKGLWRPYQEGTFADYTAMAPGDNLYFFSKRNIYGIGEVVYAGDACSYLNYPGASWPVVKKYAEVHDSLLWDIGPKSELVRWICTFRPGPQFFQLGVDMDDVLSSNPIAFRSLRSFSGLSFIKCDDIENQALKDVIYRANFKFPKPALLESVHEETHRRIAETTKTGSYRLDPAEIMESCADGVRLKHEMAIEAGLFAQLADRDNETTSVFGIWDYVSHQVVASPFKPLQWVDKMDIFGYATLPKHPTIRTRYLVCEVKRDEAKESEIDQLIKYVDWIKDEYCSGDYGMIKAFLVAHKFPKQVIEHRNAFAKRIYTIGHRPAITSTWQALTLISYQFDASSRKLLFKETSPLAAT